VDKIKASPKPQKPQTPKTQEYEKLIKQQYIK
jgi:hypothetical protein